MPHGLRCGTISLIGEAVMNDARRARARDVLELSVHTCNVGA